MNKRRNVILILLLTAVSALHAQTGARHPHVGYLYPAGGQTGTTLRILAGGQYLRRANAVHVSGDGVHARILKYYRPMRNLNKEQRRKLRLELGETWRKRLAELPPERQGELEGVRKMLGRRFPRPGKMKMSEADKLEDVELPEHPLLEDIDAKSLRELYGLVEELFLSRQKKQRNAQLAEMVLIDVEIPDNATPGDRELRVETPLGLSNPVIFQVGAYRQVREQEPNDGDFVDRLLPRPAALSLPVVINGQIMPGDRDRFRFHARRGQKLIIDVDARRLVPYLADAVPGWFQAVLTLYDDRGNEVTFADDYHFLPDPVIRCEIPETGDYELEIRDSIHRGREDFVYRLTIGASPFVARMFPLVVRAGTPATAAIDGWNLHTSRLTLDTSPGPALRSTCMRQGNIHSNPLRYAVTNLPVHTEQEPNNTPRQAPRILLPQCISGRIQQERDVDRFSFTGQAGDPLEVSLLARQLHSPLDALIRLTDSEGNVVAWSDDMSDKDSDHLHRGPGLLTHYADPRFCVKLPKDDTYVLEVSDVCNHGGPEYGYALQVRAPEPDFSLVTAPSSLSLRTSGIVPITVFAKRSGGFAGDINVSLEDPPPGFALHGTVIPAGTDRIHMTLRAPPRPLDQPVPLMLRGSSRINGRTVHRRVAPAENTTQAFLYRHLVPARELLVSVRSGWPRMPMLTLPEEEPLRVRSGDSIDVRMQVGRRPPLKAFKFELAHAPDGITLQKVNTERTNLLLHFTTDETSLEEKLQDNLIVAVFREFTPRKKGANAVKKRRRFVGVLPAIPVAITPAAPGRPR